MMQVTRTSILSGITRTIELPITQSQVETYKLGALIQNAFPNLNDSQREFFKTGITQEEWDDAFPPEFDENYEDDVMYS